MLNLVVPVYLMAAFQVDRQVPVELASVLAAEIVVVVVVVVPPIVERHSWTVFVVRLVDSASHPERAATIVGLEPADSNLDVGGLMPAGLAIVVENQHLYRLI